MKHATSRELYEYWNRVRGSARAPQRSAIEPGEIRRILADTFIAEVFDRECYQIRLAGTRICALYGKEIKGINFLDFWNGEDRSALATLAAAVCEDGAAAVVTTSVRSIRSEEISCELLLLPLHHGQKSFNRILGSFAPLEQPGWLGADPVVSQQIVSLRLIWPNENPSFMRRKSDAPVDFPAAALVSSIPVHTGRRHGHLIVMDGGKK
jgi:hypothetical protein